MIRDCPQNRDTEIFMLVLRATPLNFFKGKRLGNEVDGHQCFGANQLSFMKSSKF